MKVFYYSDKTKKQYATEAECVAAEKAYDEKHAAELKRQEERKDRADQVQKAYEAAVEAEKHYYELRNAFIKDYGSYHMTYSNTDDVSLKELFDTVFKIF